MSPDGRFLAWPGNVSSSDPWGSAVSCSWRSWTATVHASSLMSCGTQAVKAPGIRRGLRMVARSWSSTAAVACGSSTFVQANRPSAAQFDTEADWSPDGRRLLFRTNRWASPVDNNMTHLALVSRDGETIQQLTHKPSAAVVRATDLVSR